MEVSHFTSRFPWSRLLLASLFLCICPSSFSSKSPNTSTFGANEMDRIALLSFKNQITHYSFGVLDSWNDSTHFCQWQGVTCGRQHQRVTALELEGQQLVGTLSPFIGNLSFLRVINLRNNSLHGEIPQQVGHLFRLRHAFLSRNSFRGEIPANLSRCSNLIRLFLGYNNLEGKIPANLGYNLLKLISLSLDRANLTGGIPPSIGNISFLQDLSLADNNLEGVIPDSIGLLTNLKYLALGVNRLTGMIPPSVFNFSSINILSLVQNQFYGSLPLDLGFNLPNLQGFNVGGNQLSGPIPVSLSNSSLLEYIYLAENNFTGKVTVNFGGLERLRFVNFGSNNLGSGEGNDLNFLTPLTNCSNLERLGVPLNRFGGALPSSIANLSTKLTGLLMGGNQILGNIPTGIGNLINLEQLDMAVNLFTGSIPTTIGKLQKLRRLSLSGNRLSGQIPLSIGNITQLLSLYLAYNNLNGSIPSSLGNCKVMQRLTLTHNNLDGNIPKQVIGLSSLSIFLNLSHNSLTGSLPSDVGNLKNLGVLDISQNNLSGEIPSALGDCISLEILHMEGNFFQGNIPSSLNSLKAIQELNLSHNNLSGPIPEFLESFLLLRTLNLSFNNFEGEVPKNGVFGSTSTIFLGGNNKLCGGIPELQLPTCSHHKSRKRGKLPFKIVILIVTIVVPGLVLLTIFLIYYWRRKSRNFASSTFSMRDEHLRISYEELLKATDRFASSNLIGVGSFGSVYKGIIHYDGKPAPVAVKVLNLQQRGASKTFMVECNALRKIRHRNLLKIITSCSSVDFKGNDFKALVFEYMPSGSLESWLHPSIDEKHQSRYLNFSQRLDIAIDVAFALDYLQNHCPTPIVHCDIKPSNVLLDDDMTAHVGDFGLAKTLSRASNNCGEGQHSSAALKGTIGYVAPEYGTGDEVSAKGDMYSYGILLLEMFTGRRPTNDMFKDGLSLHNLSKMTLPEQIMEIMDSRLILEESQDEAIDGTEKQIEVRREVQECLVSIIRIGVACSAYSPSDRMDISDVVTELHAIKDLFLGGSHWCK